MTARRSTAERFTRSAIEIKRKDTRTLNAWDSQYLLESKPINETRLDPSKITPYAVEPTIRYANNSASMYLGQARIVGMSSRWDPSSGKLNSDASSLALVLQDEYGRRYWHRSIQLTGEIADFTEDGKTISGDDLYKIIQEAKEKGVTVASLMHKLPNARTQVIVTPGPGVVEQAPRSGRKKDA